MTINNFKTYITGTSEELTSSSKILLYNKYALEGLGYTTRISLYTIRETYEAILSGYSSSCLSLGKSTEETSYTYTWLEAKDRLPNGFDTIIYISSIDNNPIAYTEFPSAQGYEANLEISVEPSGAENTTQGLEIVNNLNPVQNIQSIQDTSMVGDTLDKHISVQEYQGDVQNYKRGIIYTTEVSGLGNGSNIKLTDRVVKGKTLYKLGMNLISSDIDLRNRFNRYSFGWYEGSPSVYAWGDTNNSYGIISLSELNRFGNNVIYSKSNNYTSENIIPGINKNTILYGAGKYFVVETSSGDIRLFDTRLKSFVSKNITGSRCYVDPFDISATIKVLPEISTYNSLVEVIPELNSTFLDIRTTFSSLELVRRVGNWFILRKKSVSGYLYALSGISSAVWMTEDEYKNATIVNDSALIINEGSYYRLCGTHGTLEKTEEYKTLTASGKETKEIEVSGIKLTTILDEGISEEDTVKGLSYKIAPKSSELFDTFLNDFRKSPYPTNLKGLPEIIGACNGVIFYEEKEDLLNYL